MIPRVGFWVRDQKSHRDVSFGLSGMELTITYNLTHFGGFTGMVVYDFDDKEVKKVEGGQQASSGLKSSGWRFW